MRCRAEFTAGGGSDLANGVPVFGDRVGTLRQQAPIFCIEFCAQHRASQGPERVAVRPPRDTVVHRQAADRSVLGETHGIFGPVLVREIDLAPIAHRRAHRPQMEPGLGQHRRGDELRLHPIEDRGLGVALFDPGELLRYSRSAPVPVAMVIGVGGGELRFRDFVCDHNSAHDMDREGERGLPASGGTFRVGIEECRR